MKKKNLLWFTAFVFEYPVNNPTAFGVVELDEFGKIENYVC